MGFFRRRIRDKIIGTIIAVVILIIAAIILGAKYGWL